MDASSICKRMVYNRLRSPIRRAQYLRFLFYRQHGHELADRAKLRGGIIEVAAASLGAPLS